MIKFQEEDLTPIDNNLYRFNVLFQLRQVESNRSQLYKDAEKEVLKTLLTCCKEVDGNKLRTIMNTIFEQSVQLRKPEATHKVRQVANTNILVDNGNTNTINDRKLKGVQKTFVVVHPNITERELHDPGMSRVSVNIKQHSGKKRSLYKSVLKRVHKRAKRTNLKNKIHQMRMENVQ